ncbi:MAG: tetratricopeptide repeat protein [Spirosomataceae bacterium]
MTVFRYILVFSLAAAFWGCSSDTRQSTQIPPLPTIDATQRAKIGVAYMSNIIRRSPRSAYNYHKRAELYFTLRNFLLALEDVDQALDMSPSNGLYLLTRARILRELKRYDEALEAARRAEILQQDKPELFVLLGDLTQQKQQYRQAKLYLSKALQMAPYDGEGYFYTGLLDAKQGDTLSGLALMQRAIELKPRFMPAYVELTTIYTRLREFEQAKEINRQGLRYFPQESALYYTLGVLYHNQKRLDSALICYRKAIVFDSTNYKADFQAGLIYLKWYSFPQAANSFQKVAKHNPQYPQINFLLGTAYDKMGNLEEAIAQYTLATEIDASDWRSRGRLYRAQQRKYYLDTYGTLPPVARETATESEEIVPEDNHESQRLQIDILTPRRDAKIRIDTTRTFKIKQ